MIVDSLKHHVGFPGDSVVNNLPAMQETWVRSLDQEDPLEWKVATHPVFLPGEFYGQRSLVGFSFQWLLVLRSTGCKCVGSIAVAHGLKGPTACGILPN